MLVWGQDLTRRLFDITILGHVVIPILGGLRACLAAMSLLCLIAVSAEFRPCHGPEARRAAEKAIEARLRARSRVRGPRASLPCAQVA